MYNIFISHSWSYSDQYKGLKDMLDAAPYFTWKNYSVPKDDPIHNAPTTAKLEAAIREQMSHASCVLILAGVYASYSKWIDIEIKLAQEMNKPVLAIRPWAARAISVPVREAADKIVGWNGPTIVSSIRELCR